MKAKKKKRIFCSKGKEKEKKKIIHVARVAVFFKGKAETKNS